MPTLSSESLRTLGVCVGLLGLMVTLLGALALGRPPDPTLTITFGGLATVSTLAPTSKGGT